jgi:hypothetical protein
MSFSETLPTNERGARSQTSLQPSLTKQERDNSPAGSSNTTATAGDMDDGPAWPTDWRAYRTLMGCFFLMFNSWGLVNAYGTFSSFYMESLMPQTPIYLLNLIGSTESFVVLILSFAIGRLLDAGFSRYILFVGWALVSTGMFTLSVSSGNGEDGQGNYALIWVTQGLTLGLGMACFFVASSQSTYPDPIYASSANVFRSRSNMVHSSEIVCYWYCGFWSQYWYVETCCPHFMNLYTDKQL